MNAQFMTLTQAAQASGLHQETIRRAINDGHLTAYKMGGTFVVFPDDLTAYHNLRPALEQRRIAAISAARKRQRARGKPAPQPRKTAADLLSYARKRADN